MKETTESNKDNRQNQSPSTAQQSMVTPRTQRRRMGLIWLAHDPTERQRDDYYHHENEHVLVKRRLSKETLQLFVAGLSKHKCKSDSNSWEDCSSVSYPWIDRDSEVQEMEELRGGVFHFNEDEVSPEDDLIQSSQDNGKVVKKVSKTWTNIYNKLKAHKNNNGSCSKRRVSL